MNQAQSQAQAQPVTVLLVDDHAMLRDALRSRLEREIDIEVVGTAGTADEAVEAARRLEPCVVVMDIDMPGRMCFAAAHDIVAFSPRTRMIYLSAFSSDRFIEDALEAHALSYLTKDQPPEVVIQAIRQAAQGLSTFSPSVRDRLTIGKNNKITLGRDDRPKTKASTLTRRELEMLRYLARGMSKKEIAATIHRSYGTVDKHIEKLMNKLDIHDRVGLARYAIREGLAEA
ncbi:MAG: response regulator transcription factor [Planctomycetota bacterium]